MQSLNLWGKSLTYQQIIPGCNQGRDNLYVGKPEEQSIKVKVSE